MIGDRARGKEEPFQKERDVSEKVTYLLTQEAQVQPGKAQETEGLRGNTGSSGEKDWGDTQKEWSSNYSGKDSLEEEVLKNWNYI